MQQQDGLAKLAQTWLAPFRNPWRFMGQVRAHVDVALLAHVRLQILIGLTFVGWAPVALVQGRSSLSAALAICGGASLVWAVSRPTMDLVEVDAEMVECGSWCLPPSTRHTVLSHYWMTLLYPWVKMVPVRARFIDHGRDGCRTQLGLGDGSIYRCASGHRVIVGQPVDLFRWIRTCRWRNLRWPLPDESIFLLLARIAQFGGSARVDDELSSHLDETPDRVCELVDLAATYGFLEVSRRYVPRRSRSVAITRCGEVALIEYARKNGVEMVPGAKKEHPWHIERNDGVVIVDSHDVSVTTGPASPIYQGSDVEDALRLLAEALREGRLHADDELDQQILDEHALELSAFLRGDVSEADGVKATRSILRIIGDTAVGVLGNALWTAISVWSGM